MRLKWSRLIPPVDCEHRGITLLSVLACWHDVRVSVKMLKHHHFSLTKEKTEAFVLEWLEKYENGTRFKISGLEGTK
jgi:hypothetical protein